MSNQTTQGNGGQASGSGGSSPPGAPNPGVSSPGAPTAPSSKNETGVAGLAHLSSFFAPLVVPLIIWLVVRDSMPYAARQAKQALFFHLIMGAFGLAMGAL